jgi:hypothetical protein
VDGVAEVSFAPPSEGFFFLLFFFFFFFASGNSSPINIDSIMIIREQFDSNFARKKSRVHLLLLLEELRRPYWEHFLL